jgi:hypothetical protein
MVEGTLRKPTRITSAAVQIRGVAFISEQSLGEAAKRKSRVAASRGKEAMSGKKVSGTFCAKHPTGEFLAKGSGHFFTARS